MNNIISFLTGVLIGNIIDIKYILFIYIIYAIIKNDQIYDGIYPRTIILQLIVWLNSKYKSNIHNDNIHNDNIHNDNNKIIKIIDITHDDVTKIYNNDNFEKFDILSLPPPPNLQLPNYNIFKK